MRAAKPPGSIACTRNSPPKRWPDFLARIAASLTIGSLLEKSKTPPGRISDLVRAIKEYTYMDQGPDQEVDIHHGLESTLLMLRHRLKHGIEVKLDFDRTLPKICARGSELNQVWTNLIDNAIDAMKGKGELRIRTARELDRLLVEIGDNGPGIPPEVRDRISSSRSLPPRASARAPDWVSKRLARIVHEHAGEITVESVPGDTRFQIRLPLPSANDIRSRCHDKMYSHQTRYKDVKPHTQRLRGMPEDGRYLGPPAAVPHLRPRGLLRFVEEQARHQALP